MPKNSIYFTLDSLSMNRGPKDIKKSLDCIPGVFSVSVNQQSKRVAVDYDDTGTTGKEIIAHIQKLGFEPRQTEHEEHLM